MGDKAGPSDTPYFNLDKSSENYIRLCRLITTICGSLLRLILSRQIEPDNLRKELDIHRTKLEKNINTQQKEQLYLKAGCKSISPKDLDISVLYVLLRNICTKLSPPKTGWGKPPQKGDNSESAFIERVRHIRNIISAHNTHGKVSDTDFQQYWEELEHSVIAMEKKLTGDDVYQDAMSKIKAMTFNKDDAEKYKLEIQQSEAQQQPIAFFAELSNDMVNPSSGQTVVFDQILTNVGNAYNPSTGIFTAPLPGTYHFNVVLSFPQNRNASHQYMLFFLLQNGRKIAYLSLDHNTDYWTHKSSSTMVQAMQGDQFWLSVGFVVARGQHTLAGHKQGEGEIHSHVSGCLIQAI